MKGGKAPTASQKRWHTWLAEQGCYLQLGPACIHHCVGSTGRHNKIHIGQWFVIPLSYEAHQGTGGIHGDLSAFDGHNLGERRKEIEKTIFNRLVAVYRRQHGEYPCPPDVLAAIEGYHR
jgi:hypothetical protein